MTNFPSKTGSRLIRALRKLGFADVRCTVVPVHRGENIGRGLLAQILRDCDITKEDLKRNFKRTSWCCGPGSFGAEQFVLNFYSRANIGR